MKYGVEKNQIEIGEEIAVNQKLYPDNYTKSNFEWHSSNTDIIEIIEGKIVGKSVGKAEIYLTDNKICSNKIEIECLINIKDILIQKKCEYKYK